MASDDAWGIANFGQTPTIEKGALQRVVGFLVLRLGKGRERPLHGAKARRLSCHSGLRRVLWLFLHQLMWGPRTYQAYTFPTRLPLHPPSSLLCIGVEMSGAIRTNKGASPRRANVLGKN